MKRYEFRYCRVLVDEQRRRVETVFSDGTQVDAVPVFDSESIARARELGYGGSDADAVWEMTCWHDLLHTVVAEAEGHPWSATLHALAHGDYGLAPGVVAREERLVLFAQRLLARGIGELLEARAR